MTNRMVTGTGAALLALSGAAEASSQWSLSTPVTRVAAEVYDLHFIMIGIILAIFIGVFGVMFYSIYAHRKSAGGSAEHFHDNLTVEIIWAIVPFLIVIAVAWPATKSILTLKDTASPDIVLEGGQLPDTELQGLDGKPFRLSQLRGKWLMLQVDSSGCAEGCRKKLLYMRQARLAQGEDAERIERVWILSDTAFPDPVLLREYPDMHVARAAGRSPFVGFPSASSPTDYIYIVDPLGNLMLRFSGDPDARRMVRDLARLLRASRIG